MTAWKRPRQELIEIGATLAHRGYNITSIAEHLTTCNFTGRDYRSAERHLAAAIAHRFYLVYAGRTEQQQQIADMADALRAEGWKPIFDTNNDRCFWQHQSTGMTVNCNGGFFHNYAAATIAAYEGALRAILNESK